MYLINRKKKKIYYESYLTSNYVTLTFIFYSFFYLYHFFFRVCNELVYLEPMVQLYKAFNQYILEIKTRQKTQSEELI